MLTKYAALAAAGACALLSAGPAGAADFNTTSVGTAVGKANRVVSNGVTYEWYDSAVVNGISFTAYGYSTETLALDSPVELGRAQLWDGGIGVLNSGDGSGANGQHTIDNSGRYDFVALVFNQSVRLTGMTLKSYSVENATPSKDAWVGYGTVTDGMSDAQLAQLWRTVLGRPLSATAGVMPNTANAVGNLWIIGAERTAVTAQRTDGFKLAGVSAVAATAAVPEPSSWAAMMLGFGLAGAALRRRRTAVAFA